MRTVSARVAARLFVEQSTYVCARQLKRLENHPLNSPTGEDKMDGIPGGVAWVGELTTERFAFRVLGCKSSGGTNESKMSRAHRDTTQEPTHPCVFSPFLVPYCLASEIRRRADCFGVPSRLFLRRAASQTVLQMNVSSRSPDTRIVPRNARCFLCSLDSFQAGGHLRVESAR